MRLTRYSFLLTLAILFLAAAGNAFAATYYLAPNGNDSYSKAQAQNLATPWKTFTHAEKQLSPGDTVIVRGGTYPLGCKIDVPNTTWKNYPGETPVIDGGQVRPSTDIYSHLLWIAADGVTWDGINVIKCGGGGVFVGAGTGNYISNPTIENCTIEDSVGINVVVAGTHNFLMDNCTVGPNYNNTGANYDVQYSDNFTIRNSVITGGPRDGLILDRGSSYGTLEYCQIYGNSLTQVALVNSTHMTVRYNLIYGIYDENKLVNGVRSYAGQAIYIESENQWGTQDNGYHKIYGNLIAGCRWNICITAQSKATPPHDCKIYNNTLIQARTNRIDNPNDFAAVRVDPTAGGGNIFENNIIWQTDGMITYVAAGKVTFDHNLWSKAPDAAAKGPHDPAYAPPDLRKVTGWDRLTPGSLDGSEFALQDGSPAIGAGVLLNGEFVKIPDCDSSNWLSNKIVLLHNDTSLGTDIGADVYQKYSTKVPSSPTNLTIVSAK